MKRKLVSVLLGTTLMVSSLAGCGNSSSTSGTTASDAGDKTAETATAAPEASDNKAEQSGDVTTLKWAVWDAATTKYWQALADAYTEKNPKVKVELTDLGSADYQTVLATDLSGDGSEFDVVTIKDVPGYATLVSKGVLEDLSDRIKADNIDLTKYNGATDQVTVDNKLYELPFRNDIWVLFYNKDLFDKAGVEYPSNDMTINEYDALCRKVAKQGFGDDTTYGSHYHTWRSTVELFGILDGKHSILDGNYDFLKPYYEMVKKQEEDGICRTYSDTNVSQLHYSAAFSAGNTATLNIGSWFIGTLITSLQSGEYDKSLCGNWGMVKYPHPEGVEAGTTIGTITSLSIPTVSKHKDEAWDFIKFASSEDGAKVVASTGNFPAIMTEDAQNIITSMDGFPQDENSKEALNSKQVYLEVPYDKNISEINTVLDTYHTDIMNGDISIDDGIAKMNEEVGKILKK